MSPVFMLPAFCPRCGAQVESLFELKPDSTRTLISIACASCLENKPMTFEQEDRPVMCEKCGAPGFRQWPFCAGCGAPARARPS